MSPAIARTCEPDPERVARTAGLTLIEILVVLGIVAALFGTGIGVFISITAVGRRQAAPQEILNLSHKARNAGPGQGASACRCLDRHA